MFFITTAGRTSAPHNTTCDNHHFDTTKTKKTSEALKDRPRTANADETKPRRLAKKLSNKNNLCKKPRWSYPVGRPTNNPHHRNSTCGKHTFHVGRMHIPHNPLHQTTQLSHVAGLKTLLLHRKADQKQHPRATPRICRTATPQC